MRSPGSDTTRRAFCQRILGQQDGELDSFRIRFRSYSHLRHIIGSYCATSDNARRSARGWLRLRSFWILKNSKRRILFQTWNVSSNYERGAKNPDCSVWIILPMLRRCWRAISYWRAQRRRCARSATREWSPPWPRSSRTWWWWVWSLIFDVWSVIVD